MITIEHYLFQWGRHPAMRSGRNLYYHCPFPWHRDSRPSFHVTTGEEVWKCFGCDVGGKIQRLICLFENISWKEAGDVAGIPARLPIIQIKDEKPKRNLADPLQQRVLSLFTQWWHEMLISPTGKRARLYANERGIANATMHKSVFGYAPWDMDGYTARSMAARIVGEIGWRGLAIAKKMGIFIRNEKKELRFQLQNRLMFSCIDPLSGKTLCYQGRAVEPSNSKLKIIDPRGITKYPFWVPNEEIAFDFSIAAESPFGPASLDRYNIAGFATLGAGVPYEYLEHVRAPILWAHDNDTEKKGSRSGEKQAAKCMRTCEELDIPSYRLLPPQFSEKHNGIDDWLIRGGYPDMIARIKEILTV